MADAPNDHRDPKVNTTAEEKSGGSIIPWILLALGVLALLAWLLGLFGGADDVAVTPAETVVEEPAVVTTEPVTPAPEADAEAPVVVTTPETDAAPADAAPNATDVETTTVPITPAEPAAPADTTAPEAVTPAEPAAPEAPAEPLTPVDPETPATNN